MHDLLLHIKGRVSATLPFQYCLIVVYADIENAEYDHKPITRK
jgi:hypothetical protein